MGIYRELKERIIQMKRERNKWRSAYEEMARTLSNSIENIIERINRMERDFHNMDLKVEALGKTTDAHSNKIDEFNEKMQKMEIHLESLSDIVEKSRKRIIELENLMEGYIENLKDLGNRMRKDATKVEAEMANLKRFKEDVKSHIDESIRLHEKTFDSVNREKIKEIEDKLKEYEKKEILLKERIEKLKEMIRKEHEKIEESRDDIKKFKEYIISYMNDLLATYETRLSMLKKDIEQSLEGICKEL